MLVVGCPSRIEALSRSWVGPLALLIALCGCGTESAPPAGEVPVTPELFLSRHASLERGWIAGRNEPAWGHDGAYVWVVAREVAIEDRTGRSDRAFLTRVPLDGSPPVRAVEGEEPRPSPTGTHLLYRALEGFWVIGGPDGVEPARLPVPSPQVPGLPLASAWAKDGSRLFVGAGAFLNEIWVVDPATLEARSLATLDGYVRAIDASPDGTWLAVHSSPEDELGPSPIERVDVLTGERATLLADGGESASPAISPDGRTLAFIEPSIPFPVDQWRYVSVLDLESLETRRLSADDTLLVEGLRWAIDGSAIFGSFKTRVTASPGVVSVEGGVTLLQTSPLREAWAAKPSPDGANLLWESVGYDGTHQVRIASADGSGERTIFDHSPEVHTYRIHDIQEVRWASSDGLELSGVLVIPKGESRTPAPLVVDIHGGPTGSLLPYGSLLVSSALEWQVWAERGVAVFVPSYRSDQIPGRAPYEALVAARELHARDAEDIRTGVQALVDQGVVDAARVFLNGHSAGGFLANYIAATENSYRGIITKGAAPDLRRALEDGDELIQSLWEYLFGPILENGDDFWAQNSPMEQSGGGTADVLIIDIDPPFSEQTRAFAARLRERGLAVERVHYPDEDHVVLTPDTQRDLLLRALAFVDARLQSP